jgi:hypothetical protein
MYDKQLLIYFEQNLKSGHTLTELKKQCLNSGHSDKIINETIEYYENLSKKKMKI